MLARQLGKIAAGIHGLPASKLPKLRQMTSTKEIADLEREYRSFDWPRPVFELALRWLRDHDPGPSEEVTLVHGDFRHGNLIIGPDGVRAVLDWELAHLGDPMEDLGWICVNSWRFGEIDKPVGGFGSREELFAGYEAAGRQVDPASREILGSDGHAALGRDVLRHDAALSHRPRPFDGARHDRPPLIGNRDRSVAVAGAAREVRDAGRTDTERTDQGGRGFPAQRHRAADQRPQRVQAARRHQRARSGDAATDAGAG